MPVAYYSKKLNATKQKYTIHNCKLIAIVHACSKWHYYLANHTTKVFSDHKPLEHFQSQPKLNSRQIRWLESLADYRLEMYYRPGKHNTVPDALSHPLLEQPPSLLAANLPAAPVTTVEQPTSSATAAATLASLVLEPGGISSVFEA